jgi:PKD repeat protein
MKTIKLGIFTIFSLFLMILMLSGCTDDGNTDTNGDADTQEYVLMAKAEASVTSGQAPLEIELTAENSTGDIVSYWWSDELGHLSDKEVPSTWVFNEPGAYDITLTVTDINDDTDTDIITITVS